MATLNRMPNFNIAREYAKIISDYKLAFSWAKHKKEYQKVYFNHEKDFYQIIAICCLEANNKIELNRLLSNELRYFYNHVVCGKPSIEKVKTKYVNQLAKDRHYKMKQVKICDMCNKLTDRYMYHNILPGKELCYKCYRKIKKPKRKSYKRKNKTSIEICDLCLNETNGNMYISIIPGSRICRSCFKRINRIKLKLRSIRK